MLKTLKKEFKNFVLSLAAWTAVLFVVSLLLGGVAYVKHPQYLTPTYLMAGTAILSMLLFVIGSLLFYFNCVKKTQEAVAKAIAMKHEKETAKHQIPGTDCRFFTGTHKNVWVWQFSSLRRGVFYVIDTHTFGDVDPEGFSLSVRHESDVRPSDVICLKMANNWASTPAKKESEDVFDYEGIFNFD